MLKLNGALYFHYSAFHADGLQSIYIAPMSGPTSVSAHGTRISAPTLAWERQGQPVNEGSFALQRDGRTFLTYSASYCGTADYKLGMLEYRGGDPLAASSWTKFANPIFQRHNGNGVYGPGHHSFFTSPDGTEIWIAYHANSSASRSPRPRSSPAPRARPAAPAPECASATSTATCVWTTRTEPPRRVRSSSSGPATACRSSGGWSADRLVVGGRAC